MPSKRNPLNLNSLQLKTLTLLQELARVAGQPAAEDDDGGLAITQLPDPHGDHFHLGEAVVAARAATRPRKPPAPAAPAISVRRLSPIARIRCRSAIPSRPRQLS